MNISRHSMPTMMRRFNSCVENQCQIQVGSFLNRVMGSRLTFQEIRDRPMSTSIEYVSRNVSMDQAKTVHIEKRKQKSQSRNRKKSSINGLIKKRLTGRRSKSSLEPIYQAMKTKSRASQLFNFNYTFNAIDEEFETKEVTVYRPSVDQTKTSKD